jgi:hypothetical protein
MNDADRWIYFDGPEPEHIRPLLDALRDLPPATPEDKERVIRRFFYKLDATLSRREEPAGGEEGQRSDAPGALIAPVAPVAPIAPIAPPEAERRWAGGGPTARSPRLADLRDASPKAEPSAPEEPFEARGPRAADTGAAPEGPAERATEGAVGTALVPDLPAEFWERLGRLPFRPASPEQATAERTMKLPVMGRGQGETAPVRADSIAKAVAALPFAGNTVGSGIVLIPRLKMQEYASLRAELAVWPEWVREILLRYQVLSEASRRALEEDWAERLLANPGERAAFERAVGEYSAWLRGRRGGGGGGEAGGGVIDPCIVR